MLLASIPGAVAQTPVASPEASPAATPVATVPGVGIQPADMDLTVDPGDDFYQFANGGWLARTKLPADEARYGVFDEINDRVNEELYGVIDGLDTDRSTAEGKARAIYEQYIDMETRDAQGVDPLQPVLDQMQAITTIDEGLAFQQVADTYQLGGLFAPYADASPEDATITSGYLAGPFLSLPSEDYYLDDSEGGQAIRDAWVETTAQLLMELGYAEDEATTAAETVLAFDRELVGIKTPDAELYSDPVLRNNPRTLDELEEILPSMDWEGFVQDSHLADRTDTLIVVDLAYFEGLEAVLAKADPLTLQHLFVTQLIWAYAPYLTTEIGDLYFSFVGGVLQGITERAPIEERALNTVRTAFPDAISQAYVAAYFPPEAKEQIEQLVDNLVAAFRIRIAQNPWMSEETKAKALEKLDLMVVAVGYPDTWRTYDDVEVGESLFETHVNAYQAGNAERLGKVGEPVDRTEWFLNAIDVNAGYDPARNLMTYPAAILQAPFFDPEADLAANYGAIGAVIGHEITHGFDLSGSQYDGNGNLVSWWTEEDFEAFTALNDRVIARYATIEVQPGLTVDGELTVTENVADMGGLQIAYDALMIALAADDGHSPAILKQEEPWFLTQQQRFFIAASTNWREVATPEAYEFLVASDEHAPGPVRGVEPLRHMDAFYEAFDIDAGDAEYLPPEDRIVIW
jgi:predicted metalloendopeptidase